MLGDSLPKVLQVPGSIERNLLRGGNMDSTVTNSTAKSGSEQAFAKHESKLYAGIAALALVAVVTVVVAPKLFHEAPVSAAAPATVVTVAQPLQPLQQPKPERQYPHIALFCVSRSLARLWIPPCHL